MATSMFLRGYGKNSTFNKKDDVWPSVDSCSDHKYIKNFNRNLILR